MSAFNPHVKIPPEEYQKFKKKEELRRKDIAKDIERSIPVRELLDMGLKLRSIVVDGRRVR